jgi:hypothetical protein
MYIHEALTLALKSGEGIIFPTKYAIPIIIYPTNRYGDGLVVCTWNSYRQCVMLSSNWQPSASMLTHGAWTVSKYTASLSEIDETAKRAFDSVIDYLQNRDTMFKAYSAHPNLVSRIASAESRSPINGLLERLKIAIAILFKSE